MHKVVTLGGAAISNDNGKITTIENATIMNSYRVCWAYNTSNIIVNNITANRLDYNGNPANLHGMCIEHNGTIIFNDGNVKTNYAAGWNNYGKLYINGGTLETTSTNDAIVNDYKSGGAVLEMTGGHVKGKGNTIQNKNNGLVVITGGTVESTENVAIYNESRGTITIGDNTNSISTESPVIKSTTTTINNISGTLNFYDGVLIGTKNTVITGLLSEIPVDTEIVREIKQDNLQYVTIGIPTYYVAQIPVSDNPNVSLLDPDYYTIDNGYYKFVTLDSAIIASSKTNSTNIELLDDVWIYRKQTIDADQDITIKTKDNGIYIFTSLAFDNRGNLNVTNETNQSKSVIKAVSGWVIDNKAGATAEFNNVNINISGINHGTGNESSPFINSGTLIMNNIDYGNTVASDGNGWFNFITNKGYGKLRIDNLTITESARNTFLYNIAEDTLDNQNNVINSVEIDNSTISYGGTGIFNNGTGTIKIEDSTLTGYSYGDTIRNDSTGNMYIIRCTLNTNYGIRNYSTGYIELEDFIANSAASNVPIVNNAGGKVTIKGNNTNISGGIQNNHDSSTLEIIGGTITANNPVINSGNVTITGSNLTGVYQAITNNPTGTVVLKGDNLNVLSQGYEGLWNKGTAIVESGTIKSNSTYGIGNSGTVTLGTKDGIVNYKPIINGKNVGIHNTGTLNFYDGIIEGPETNSIYGIIPAETEEGSIRVIHKGEMTFKQGTADEYQIAAGREISVLEQVHVAHVVSNNTDYLSLQAAYDHTQSTDTIEIIHDASINGNVAPLEIEAGKDITIDLKGYNVVAGNNTTILNNGTLTLKDSKRLEGANTIEGNFINGANTILDNRGTCTIESGNYSLTLGGTSSALYDLIKNTGTLTINNGVFTAQGSYTNLINAVSGNISINDGTFNLTTSYISYDYILKSGTGNIIINNGTFNAEQSYCYAIWNEGSGTVTAINGTIKGYIYNQTTGTITIGKEEYDSVNDEYIVSGPTITSCCIQNYGTGTINFKGGSITNGNDFYNASTGTINITGGTIVSNNPSYNGIENTNTGTINIDGTRRTAANPISISKINGSNCGSIANWSGNLNIKGYVEIVDPRLAIWNQVGTTTVEGPVNITETGSWALYHEAAGTIIIKDGVTINAAQIGIYTHGNGTTTIKNNVTINAGTHGIYADNQDTVIIGDSDNIDNSVKITGETSGITAYYSNNNNLEYYGGTIKGAVAVNGFIKEIPAGYDIVRTQVGGYDTYEIGHVTAVASVGGVPKNSIQEAIDDISGTGTVVLLKDVSYAEGQTITIPSGKNITLDLNNNRIKVHNYDVQFLNEGTFKITDDSQAAEGKIEGYAGTLIQNEGTFEMLGGTISIVQSTNGKIIYNTGNGQVKITNGHIECNCNIGQVSYYMIYSDNNNDIEIDDGVFVLNGGYYTDQHIIYATVAGINIYIKGGSYTGSGGYTRVVRLNNGGNVEFSGNTSVASFTGVLTYGGGTITVKDNAKLNTTDYAMYANYDRQEDFVVNIQGGEVYGINASARPANQSHVNITGGKVTANINSCHNVDIYSGAEVDSTGNGIENCGNVTLHSGAIVKASNSSIANCNKIDIEHATVTGYIHIQNQGTILNMTSGSVTGVAHGIYVNHGNAQVNIIGGEITATNGAGITLNYGTLTLGEDTGGYPSTVNPAITGKTYGVANTSGTFNFYDGILTGQTYATSGTVGDTPEYFSTQYSVDGTVAILGINATFTQVATVNGIYYDDLQSAINAAARINGEVVLGKELYLESGISIPSGSTVTLDMAGFSVYGFTETPFVTVEAADANAGTGAATLIIKDSESQDSTNSVYSCIENSMGPAIENNGILTIGENDETVYTYTPRIIGKVSGIVNNGTLNFYDGQIGTKETGNPVTVNATAVLPTGYTTTMQGNNYVLVAE